MNPADRREAATAYDEALSALVGCKGLITEPMTEGKLTLLRQRLSKSGGALARCFAFVGDAHAEPPFIPPRRAPEPVALPPGVADLSERRSRKSKGPR